MVNMLTKGIPADKRSVLRRIEDLLPQIEDGLAKGYSHAAMHAELPVLGINISLPYYHRVLHKLRAERRLAGFGLTPTREKTPEPQAQQGSAANALDLNSAFAEGCLDAIGTIVTESEEPKPFRWKGHDVLTRDFSKF
ncbi:hypothetical protein [Massilia phyllosphaerae]|uniref:hypothetical protein n=1 Tax=Massilia phyllosphaerae TaxID=3106034 RepID=UPI002B1CB716|nr:hypothetical protein [Massilia sp. SGZ-792]